MFGFVAQYNRIKCNQSINQHGSRLVYLQVPSAKLSISLCRVKVKVKVPRKNIRRKLLGLDGVIHVLGQFFVKEVLK